MQVMVLAKATKNSEAGLLPGHPRAPAGCETLFEEMGRFNEELVKAGVMLAADGLHPSGRGKRARFSGGEKTVVHGPFSATNEVGATPFHLLASRGERTSWPEPGVEPKRHPSGSSRRSPR